MPTDTTNSTRTDLTIAAAYGRLYVSGARASALMPLPGAAFNERRRAVELSLTVETLRGIRDKLGWTREQLARACPPNVLAWARVAHASETQVRDVHARLERGDRVAFPWHDTGWRAEGLNGPRAPFDHQRVMASAAAWLDGVYFNADPGTGKTRAALEAAAHRVASNEVDVVLVICPRRAGKTWKDETPMWTPSLTCVRLTSGPTKERSARLVRAARGEVLVLNVDVLRHCIRAIRDLTRRVRVLLVIDEAHKFKNPNSQRTKILLDLAPHCPVRVLMSGSPVLQGVQDVWAQWYGVDLGLTFGANFVQYRREFLDENPYTMTLTAKDGAEIAVGQRMRKRGLRFEKDVLPDLPPKLYTTLECEMTQEQAIAYRTMADELMAMLDEQGESVAEASNQLVAMMRLTQITSGWVKTSDGTIHRFDPNPKLDLLEEVVRETSRGTAGIIWTRYREDVAAIVRRIGSLRPSVIQGGMSDVATDDAQDRFNDGTTDWLVGNAKAGSSSLNLQRASVAYYFSQDYALEDRIQSEDRCHRQGSQCHAHVLYGDLVCAGTIDADVAAVLQRKQNVASLVSNLRAHVRAIAH